MGRIAEALARAERERGTGGFAPERRGGRGVATRGPACAESRFGGDRGVELETEGKRDGDGGTDQGALREAYPMSAAINRWSEWYGAAGETEPRVDENATTSKSAPVAGMSPQVVTYYDRSSLASEQYRSLRTRLLSQNPYQERRMWAVTSAVPKEGKSLTTVNLAFSLAEIRHLRVLIVDCDFRHSSLAKMVNAPNEPGLADMLQDRATYDEIILPTPVPNLFFAPAGRTHGRSAPELLSTPTARATFARFQREFHYTIVDTPPAATVADVGIIGQMTSGVLFVVRMHRTPEPLAKRAVKHLLNNSVPIVGAVVVGDDDPTGGYGRPYSYYRYYREGGDKE
ncbi:MAG: CpsD/CapB family tyrosine-protein kinase [Phycisphaerales bacterium]|nr:CpsD/CapB family tyrosine-protein kinase [Phycisphaerales bacterium]